MAIRLRDIRACFEGVIPSIIATVDGDGMPNLSYLSHVYYIDDDHVALSNQFFSKTAENVRARGQATLLVVDGRSGEQYLLDLAYEGAQRRGELFDRMAAHLQVISSRQGMADVMVLRSADTYRVLGCRPVASPDGPAGAALVEPPAVDHLAAAAQLALAIAAQPSIDAMLDRTLEGLGAAFGFPQAMVLIADAAHGRLTVLASRGYGTLGIGSEVAIGEGAIGIAAARRYPLRISDMSRGRRYAAAVRTALATEDRTIPFPGLTDPQSQLAVPMVSRGRLLGVLFAESPDRFRFTQADEDALALIAGQLGAGLRQLDTEEREEALPDPPDAPPPAVPAARFRVRHFAHDDSIFIDDAYLIKGVPGRLLHHCLRVFAASGRRDFSNRELRLDPALRLPGVKDNLETRLILLRRRLEERAAPIRLARPARGRLRLELSGMPVLESG